MVRILVSFVLTFGFLFTGEKETRVLQELVDRKEAINQAGTSAGISPRIVASIIYSERLRNFNWDDAVLDDITALTGYNSSIGFAQIKISTAFWIEEQTNDRAGKFYLGSNARLTRSHSREELIDRLTNDSLSIEYCSRYIAMIKKRWKGAGFNFAQQNEAGLLGTLYSLGIIRPDGTDRLPSENPSMNDFGITAQSFFDSFALRDDFPD